MTFKGQGRDPDIFKASYFENSFNGSPSPSQPYIKAVTKFTWRIYVLSERLLVEIVAAFLFGIFEDCFTVR